MSKFDWLRVPSAWERFSIRDCIRIAKIDAPSVASRVDEFIDLNMLGYYTLLNTWILQWEAVSRSSAELLRIELEKIGLFKVISSLSDDADVLCKHVANDFNTAYLSDFASKLLGPVVDTRQALQLLRYPKRFSPLGADKLAQESIDSFLESNSLCGEWNDRHLNNLLGLEGAEGSLFRDVHRVLHDLLPGSTWFYKTSFGILSPKDHLDDFKISSGAVYEKNARSYSERARLIAPLIIDRYPNIFWGTPTINGIMRRYWKAADEAQGWVGLGWCDRVLTVPKNYKKARVIAPQPAICNTALYRVQDCIREYLKRNCVPITFRDQTPNQLAARDGSLTGKYATIDLTSASDRVPWKLVRDLFPVWFIRSVFPWLPTRHIVAGHGRVPNHMFAASGSVITFPVETLVFWSVCEAVRRGLEDPSILITIAYGDDILVDVRIVEEVIKALEMCNASVNIEKSYISSDYLFRESCGVEYYKGLPLDTHYFPRKPLSLAQEELVTTVASLIDLQHRFYYTPNVSYFLYSLVTRIKPSMTSSCAGSTLPDLWEIGATPCTKSRIWGPRDIHGNLGSGEETLSEQHYVLSSKASTPKADETLKNAFAEFLIYQEYLRFGPMYSSPIDMLSGVSTSRFPVHYVAPSTTSWILS